MPDKKSGRSEHLIDKISDLMAGYGQKLEKVIKDEKSGVFDNLPSQKHGIWTPPKSCFKIPNGTMGNAS